MADLPFPITARDAQKLIEQTKLMLDDLYSERIGGALLGDVMTIGVDDVLAINLSTTGGLQKSSSQLQIWNKTDGGLASGASGEYLKCKSGGGLATDANGAYVLAAMYSFGTIDCPAGTDPVADAGGDTLNLIDGSGIDITGDATADSVTIALDAAAQAAVTASHARSHSIVGGSDHTWPVTNKTSTYTVVAADNIIICNSSTAFTVNLREAWGGGRPLTIKNIGTGAVTVDGYGSQTMDGSTTQILGQWDSITIVDASITSWVII